MWRFLLAVLVFLAHLAPTHTSQWSITSYAALGDSYAAGSGAGSPVASTATSCGRFNSSYPRQVATHPSMQGIAFHNLACGGATTSSVLQSQLAWIDDAQIVTLTVGGNEVDFFGVLNECVYQWRPTGRGCQAELDRSRGLIESGSFLSRFDAMVKGIVDAVGAEGRLFVTGYARFFNHSTVQCDGVSFSRTDPSHKLSRQLRMTLNELVDRLNDVIRAAAMAHGAEYVDMDALFEGHRFCEPGVVEPAGARGETWFFNLHHDERHHTAQQQYEGLSVPFPNPVKDFLDLTKVFHPTSVGHKAIAEEIVRLIQHG